MKDDLPKDDDAPVKVSFHSLKDEEPEEENSKPVEPEEEKEISKPEEQGEYPLDNEDSEESGEDEEEVDDEHEPEQYYLQVVKVGEQPEWPRPKEDLDVFSQPIDGGLIQYWAYPKELTKSAEDLPRAEDTANKNSTDDAVIIIDQVCHHLTEGSCLELILAKDHHALAKTDSNLENLESNVTSLLDIAKQNFGIKAEHFISTGNVSPEVEKRLDDLEEAEEEKIKEKEADHTEAIEENQTPLYFNDRPAVVGENKRSKWVIFIPILILIIIFGGVVYYREKLLSKIMNKVNPPKQETVVVTPFPTPTPTPAPSVERANFKVRVLNGTPTTGAAGALADKLKAKGWLIDRTGNATSSAILESYIRAKPGNDEAIKVLLTDVEDYQGSSSSSPLKLTDKADLEFVIGRK